MDNFYLFVAAGVIIVFLIIQYDISQRKRLKKVLKKTSKVEPLFMRQSAAKKLTAIKSAITDYENMLLNNGTGVQTDAILSKVNAKLEETIVAYNNGKITLAQYYDTLSKLYDGFATYRQKMLSPVMSR